MMYGAQFGLGLWGKSGFTGTLSFSIGGWLTRQKCVHWCKQRCGLGFLQNVVLPRSPSLAGAWNLWNV